MTLHQQVRQRLYDIEQAMRDAEIWQPPARAAFDSVEPFCIDTMDAQQWLQWVLLPRTHALLDRDAPLPERFALTPYFEEALPEAIALLTQIRQLDCLLGGDAHD